MIYQWKDGAHIGKADSQKVGERLEVLDREFKGLTAQVVLDDARSPKSPVHQIIEWDNEVAAERFRLSQAGYVLRVLTIVNPNSGDPDKTIRAYFAVAGTDGGKVFMPLMRILEDHEYRAQLVGEAIAELSRVRHKYEDLTELADVFSAIEVAETKA